MADEAGQKPPALNMPALVRDLERKPEEFSFFQAVRIFAAYAAETEGKETAAFLRDSLRVRPVLSLAFPSTDLVEAHVEKNGLPAEDETDLADGSAEAPEGNTYQLTATFLGLYGTGSPLPTYYTEELLDESAEDGSVSRDFLDIVGQPFFALLFRGWNKYRLMTKVELEKDPVYLERLYSLIGLADPSFRRKTAIHRKALRYIGLLSQFPHSAAGLESMLEDFLQTDTVVVEQCPLRMVAVPASQLTLLGKESSRLGNSMVIGQEIAERMGLIRIHIYLRDAGAFQTLHPHQPLYEELRQLVDLYLTEPLEYETHFHLPPGAVRTTSLGAGSWNSLGWNTWLFSGDAQTDPVAPIAMSCLGPDGHVADTARELIFQLHG